MPKNLGDKTGRTSLITYCFLEETRKGIHKRRNSGCLTRGSRRVKRGDHGFSLLELVAVIVVISFLLVIAISRLLALQVDAERVAMQTVLGTLRSAIGMKVAKSIVRNEVSGLRALVGGNPMDRLAELPSNYLGELKNVDPAQQQAGNWYFDSAAKTLVYLVRNKGHFTGGSPGTPRARFAIELVFADKNSNGVFDRRVDSIQGLRLSALEPYRWTN